MTESSFSMALDNNNNNNKTKDNYSYNSYSNQENHPTENIPFVTATTTSITPIPHTHTNIQPGTPFVAGLELWKPPLPNTYSDGLPVYELLGTDAPFVQIPLRPGRQVMCFADAMAYMSDGIQMKVQLGGLGTTFGRIAGGGSLFQVTYTNESEQDGYIALASDYPGVLVPIHMHSCLSDKIIAMRDSFLGAIVGMGEQDPNHPKTEVSAGFNPAQSIAGICCSGVDLIVQTISHGEWVFLMAMGTVLQKTLQAGEKLLIDTDSILCFESSVSIDVQFIGSGIACCCAGEGIFNTTLTGPGKIWIQSLSIDKMRKLFPPKVVQQGGAVNNNQNASGGNTNLGDLLGLQLPGR